MQPSDGAPRLGPSEHVVDHQLHLWTWQDTEKPAFRSPPPAAVAANPPKRTSTLRSSVATHAGGSRNAGCAVAREQALLRCRQQLGASQSAASASSAAWTAAAPVGLRLSCPAPHSPAVVGQVSPVLRPVLAQSSRTTKRTGATLLHMPSGLTGVSASMAVPGQKKVYVYVTL